MDRHNSIKGPNIKAEIAKYPLSLHALLLNSKLVSPLQLATLSAGEKQH